MTPRATYRFQFHKDFTFGDAERLVPYLDGLGISHLYASPITTAAAGSTHGYDVIDPTRINPELGAEDAFRSLIAALKARGMGCIIDIVPNHMGVAGGDNAWWNDVLARGESSEFARFFDIDWRRKIVLPVLGDPLGQVLADGQIAVERAGERWQIVAYGEHRFPIRDEDQAGADSADLAALIDRQHYRLASWKTANDELNWRRFFTVSELAGLRIEDQAVFDRTHALYLRLFEEGLIDGVRVDHVDGLTDPAGYCRKLRQLLGPDAYIVIEKILGEGEPLSTDWGVDGTSGYDFMEEAAALLHDAEGEAPLAALWHEISGRPADYAPEELQAKQDMLAWAFEGQLAACVDALATLARSAPATEGITAGMLRRAVERMLWVFPVYRTYGLGVSAPASDAAIRAIVRERVARFVPPGEQPVVDIVLSWLAGEGPGDRVLAAEAVRRFQQLSAPIAAKAVEDTAFYRYGRLLSRNDVGFAPATFAMPIATFHDRMVSRAGVWPHAMLTTATHDHKRGEDVRARLAVISELPGAWRERVEHWAGLVPADGVDPADRYMLFQTLYGAWPGDDLTGFADRVNAWQQKALREAKLRSSWEAPNTAYEARCSALTEAMLSSDAFVADMRDWIAHLSAPALANSLAQVALRYTVPGVPDLYQGTEWADLSLVDPDNRRPVDFAARHEMIDGGDPKFDLIRHLLHLRRESPALFADGGYRALPVTGERADHVLAFERDGGGKRLRVAITLHAAAALAGSEHPTLSAGWWADTAVDGQPVAELFTAGPVSATVT